MEYFPVPIGELAQNSGTCPKIVYCSLMIKNNSDLFYSALQSLPQFVMETDADWGMVYDFMESQCGELKDYHWEEVAEVYKEFMNDSRY